jgi:hypothetical protein
VTRIVGHLIEIPLTNGKRSLVDPCEIAEVSSQDEGITLVRCRDQRFVHYCRAPYEAVVEWLSDGFAVAKRPPEGES